MKTAVLVLAQLAASVAAADTAPVVVAIAAPATPRVLDPRWFGSGSEYYCGGFIAARSHPAAMAALRETGIGFLRWPQGTSALWYFWDEPRQSYAQPWMQGFLAPGDFVAAARDLGVESLAQVNTWAYRRPGGSDFESAKVLVAPGNVGQAADYAARWVARARADRDGIRWWEIGNEDWVYWSGRQHAALVTAYARAMRAADPDIHLLAQGLVGGWSGDWQAGDGETWTGELARTLPEAAVDGLSLHLYLHGGHLPGTPRSLAEETAGLFAAVARDDRLGRCRDLLARLGRGRWQLWVTEYNLMQPDPGGPGGLLRWQNLAHALVLADWTGRLLLQGADRLAVHDLAGHPVFELVDLAHRGSPDAPLLTAPALALQAFAGERGGELLHATASADPERLAGSFAGEDGSLIAARYPAVGAYALRRTDGGLRVVLVNRDLAAPVTVALAGLAAALPAATPVRLRRLGAGCGLDADGTAAHPLAWSETAATAGDLARLELPAHSLTVCLLPPAR